MEELEKVFAYDATPLKFGEGVTEEIGADIERLGLKSVMLFTDAHLASLGFAGRVANSITGAGASVEVFDRVHSEPTEESWQEAIDQARAKQPDGFVAVGGGSTIDTAKAANLYSVYPAELSEYIARPLGRARPVPGPLKPLIGIPTTSGTASECTTVAVVGLKKCNMKTAVSHRRLRPAAALLDPLNTVSCPPLVTASCGMDVLCHAIESYTARPFYERKRPEHPDLRPPFGGANPISDIWSAEAIRLVPQYLARAVRRGDDIEARRFLMLACTYAGMGFSNAGVHILHAMGYPIASYTSEYRPPGYPTSDAMVPHGISVVIGAPAAVRITASSNPQKYLEVARLMGCDVSNAGPDDAGELVARALVKLMRETGIPNGLAALGYGPQDVPALARGTIEQKRLLLQCPGQVTEEDLERIYEDAMSYW